jgi:hypothetical protein
MGAHWVPPHCAHSLSVMRCSGPPGQVAGAIQTVLFLESSASRLPSMMDRQ